MRKPNAMRGVPTSLSEASSGKIPFSLRIVRTLPMTKSRCLLPHLLHRPELLSIFSRSGELLSSFGSGGHEGHAMYISSSLSSTFSAGRMQSPPHVGHFIRGIFLSDVK